MHFTFVARDSQVRKKTNISSSPKGKDIEMLTVNETGSDKYDCEF